MIDDRILNNSLHHRPVVRDKWELTMVYHGVLLGIPFFDTSTHRKLKKISAPNNFISFSIYISYQWHPPSLKVAIGTDIGLGQEYQILPLAKVCSLSQLHSPRKPIQSEDQILQPYQKHPLIFVDSSIFCHVFSFHTDLNRERKAIKAKFQVMALTLSKEIGMVKSQLNHWRATGCESFFLQEEAKLPSALVDKQLMVHPLMSEVMDQESGLMILTPYELDKFILEIGKWLSRRHILCNWVAKAAASNNKWRGFTFHFSSTLFFSPKTRQVLVALLLDVVNTYGVVFLLFKDVAMLLL
ncbi:hypothetical protein L6452_22239 [Arctium lappa]|uniref:Uncharacterized protein n=1 Tax=Arctium lappa TaxID=4217 RepID=A0ACB9AZ94_ARCLA|nr:hypothetical protein L6452_22239 [Arctium lappa]